MISKKMKVFAVVIVLSLSFSIFSVYAEDGETVRIGDGEKLWVNGTYLFFDNKPVVIEGRAFVPIRDVMAELGYFVRWDLETRSIMASNFDNVIKMRKNSDVIEFNGKEQKISAKVFINNGTSYMPADLLSTALRQTVYLSESSNTVVIGRGFNPDNYYNIKFRIEGYELLDSKCKVSFSEQKVRMEQDGEEHIYELSSLFDKVENRPVFAVKTQSMENGSITYVYAENVVDTDELYIKSDLKTSEFFFDGKGYKAIIASDFNTPGGLYSVDCAVKRNGKFINNVRFDMEVLGRDFEEETLNIWYATKKPPKETAFQRAHRISFAKDVYKPKVDFEEFLKGFVLPVNGELTTEYGVIRHANNNTFIRRHSGLDIANSSGMPIQSTADGKVVFSNWLNATGNTVIISHGYNIFSVYYHMSARTVHNGQIVKAGQRIGNIGSTGMSTGPHLHFEITFGDMRLEPGMFVYGEKLLYSTYKKFFTR